MLNPEEREQIELELTRYPTKRAVCIDALKIVQRHRGWVSDEGLKDIAEILEMSMEELAGVAAAAPPSTFRISGAKIPRQTHRHSGRTAELVQISVHEPKPPEDSDSPLAFSMEGSPDQAPAAVTPFFWSPGWNSIQSEMKFQAEINGPLRGGDAGVRMVEPRSTTQAIYFSPPPAAVRSPEDEWLVVPLYHIFGSEELSRLAPAVAVLAPKPYLALNPEDSRVIELSAGGEVELKVAGSTCRLAVEVRSDLPRGMAGVAAGLTSLGGMSLPAWGRIARVL